MSSKKPGQRCFPRRIAIPEAEWPARIRAGDERAFEAMFRAYYDQLYRYVIALLGERDVAEDVVQLVFARIWQERETWDVHGPLRHYLFAAARWGAISHLRHHAVRERATPLLVLEAAAKDTSTRTDAAVEAEELHCRFLRVLETLPPRARQAFVLTRTEGLTYHEAAIRMGISVRTVEVHVSKALSILRKLLLVATALLYGWPEMF